MKKIALVITLLCAFVLPLAASTATSILDKSAAALRRAGDVKIEFAFTMGGSTSEGYIKIQGNKFVLSMGGMITWFDGKTMWQYSKKNEEVSVTEPSKSEIAKINPYSFLSFYKNGYSASMGKSTAADHQVVLSGHGASQYKNVKMKINKKSLYPTQIDLTTTSGHSLSISCKSVRKNQSFPASTFSFSKKKFPEAEIVDLR